MSTVFAIWEILDFGADGAGGGEDYGGCRAVSVRRLWGGDWRGGRVGGRSRGIKRRVVSEEKTVWRARSSSLSSLLWRSAV